MSRPFAALLLLGLAPLALGAPVPGAPAAPELSVRDPKAWINSPPVRLSDLRGQVVLVDLWTFGCWNCYRSFPWLKDLEARFWPQGLRVIGVHSPEFDHERDPAAVAAKVKGFGLDHPVMIDNDHAYWRALGNRYWPAFYLIDKQGRLRHKFVGETHAGDAQAQAIEGAVVELLRE